GGSFTDAGGDTNVQYVAKLVGTNWTAVGNGLSVTNGGGVRAIASIGDAIYIGGDFTAAGTNANVKYLAKLVGNTWTNLGSGVNGTGRGLGVCSSYLDAGGGFASGGCIASVRWSDRAV